MPITTWHCTTCAKNWHQHLTACPRCQAKRTSYEMQGHAVTPDAKHDDAERAEVNRQARLKRKIRPADDKAGEGFITSTMPTGTERCNLCEGKDIDCPLCLGSGDVSVIYE